MCSMHLRRSEALASAPTNAKKKNNFVWTLILVFDVLRNKSLLLHLKIVSTPFKSIMSPPK